MNIKPAAQQGRIIRRRWKDILCYVAAALVAVALAILGVKAIFG